MLTNLISFFCGILMFGLIVFFANRQERKLKSLLLMVHFEKKNDIIKATTVDGNVFWSNEFSIRSNPRHWWQQGNKNKQGLLEESLSHLYWTNQLKKKWDEEVVQADPSAPRPSKTVKFN